MTKRSPSEKEIQQQVDEYLALDNWRVFRTDLPHLRGLGVQEPGIPDRQYVRYLYPAPAANAHDYCQMFWVEHKKRGGKAGEHQKAWHERERALGALVIVAGTDFDASLDGFVRWYEQSCLQRKRITLGAVRK